jgi:flagellar protein FlaI
VRNFYIPIEPSFLHSVNQMMPVVESKLIDLIDGLEDDPITDKERGPTSSGRCLQTLRSPNPVVQALRQ